MGLTRVCAWCNTVLGEKAGHERGITSTICPDCVDNLDFQVGTSRQRLLDSLPLPVLVVDSTGAALAANAAARALVGKAIDHIVGHLGGDIFECEYARLPRGCGQTIHCSGCAVRRSVMTTFTTGKPCRRVPAQLRPYPKDAEHRQIDLLISTEKVGDTVWLQIDEVSAPAPS